MTIKSISFKKWITLEDYFLHKNVLYLSVGIYELSWISFYICCMLVIVCFGFLIIFFKCRSWIFLLKRLRQLVWRLLLRWKNVLDWRKCPISMFSEIFSPDEHVLATLFKEIRNQLSSLVIPSKFMLPFWNLQKLTIFYRTAKSTLAGSSRNLLHMVSVRLQN